MQVILSYTQHDDKIMEQIHFHLQTLSKEGLISALSIHQIMAGGETELTLNPFSQADLVIPLINKQYMSLYYLFSNAIRKALLNKMEGEVIIVPVIIDSCDWSNTLFNNFTTLPLNNYPVSQWESKAKAMETIIQEFRQLLTDGIKGLWANPWSTSLRLNILSPGYEKLKFSKKSFAQIKMYLKEYMQKISLLLDLHGTVYLENCFKFESIIKNANCLKQSKIIISLSEQKLPFFSGCLPIIQLRYYFDNERYLQNKVFILSSDNGNLFWILHESFSGLRKTHQFLPKEIAKLIWDDWMNKSDLL